jgi:hypothetical protein
MPLPVSAEINRRPALHRELANRADLLAVGQATIVFPP